MSKISQFDRTCECRNCNKRYVAHKATADYKGYCTQKCFLAKARQMGWKPKSKANFHIKMMETPYAILSRNGLIGDWRPEAFNHAIKSDNRLNPQLRAEVQGLRGAITSQAESVQLPRRFVATPSTLKPEIAIRDTVTGKLAHVPMFAYGEVRRVLAELFSEVK